MLTGPTHSLTFARRVLLTGLLSLVSLASPLAHGFQPPDDDRWNSEGRGAVFTLTNSPAGNAVVAYRRATNGSLRMVGSFPNGGLGTGAGLFSQGAVPLRLQTSASDWPAAGSRTPYSSGPCSVHSL
jgi:hypothetical protein